MTESEARKLMKIVLGMDVALGDLMTMAKKEEGNSRLSRNVAKLLAKQHNAIEAIIKAHPTLRSMDE